MGNSVAVRSGCIDERTKSNHPGTCLGHTSPLEAGKARAGHDLDLADLQKIIYQTIQNRSRVYYRGVVGA